MMDGPWLQRWHQIMASRVHIPNGSRGGWSSEITGKEIWIAEDTGNGECEFSRFYIWWENAVPGKLVAVSSPMYKYGRSYGWRLEVIGKDLRWLLSRIGEKMNQIKWLANLYQDTGNIHFFFTLRLYLQQFILKK